MSLPLARSNADRMPPIPSVKTRPPAMAGVDFGPATVRPRGRIDGVWRGIRRAPDLLARRHIEGADNLLIALTGDHHDPIAGHHRRGMPGADRDLPAFLQRFRPLGGQCGENGTIALRAAPLWPVGAGLRAGCRQRRSDTANTTRARLFIFVLDCAGPHPRACPGRSPLALRARARGYEDLNATIGSTREARRAGTSAATSATAISNTAMAM